MSCPALHYRRPLLSLCPECRGFAVFYASLSTVSGASAVVPGGVARSNRRLLVKRLSRDHNTRSPFAPICPHQWAVRTPRLDPRIEAYYCEVRIALPFGIRISPRLRRCACMGGAHQVVHALHFYIPPFMQASVITPKLPESRSGLRSTDVSDCILLFGRAACGGRGG